MMSGVMRCVSDSACSPSSATSTVMPASSIASVSMRNVFGESSTTRTMLRGSCLFSFFPSGLLMANLERLEDVNTALEIETIGDPPHIRDKILMRGIALDAAQLVLDAAHIADLRQADQLGDLAGRRNGVPLQK